MATWRWSSAQARAELAKDFALMIAPAARPSRSIALADERLADGRSDGVSGHAERAFTPEAEPELGETHALVIVQGGRLVLERYAAGFGPDITCKSWSMAKSITHALAGVLVGDGRLDIHAPADVPEWCSPGDARGAITLDQLLRMSSGLAFVEDYSPEHPSDVIEMLFGKGQDDMAAFAASFPLAQSPGSFFAYSSGTTNIVSRCAARALGADGPAFEAFMRERLFAPLGMTSADPRFDAAGTFIGSSYCFATPRDFARFGLLYLRNGMWEGRRAPAPRAGSTHARAPTFQQPGGEIDGRPMARTGGWTWRARAPSPPTAMTASTSSSVRTVT